MPPGAKRRKIYYWDSCIFIAWLGLDDWNGEVIQGIDQLYSDVARGEAVIVTSVLTRAEIFLERMSRDQKNRYQEIMQHRRLQEVELTKRVAEVASEIRAFYLSRALEIKTPDSIHLATAIQFDVDCL